MRKFWSLSIALMKNNFNFITDGNDKKGKAIAQYVLLTVCMLPLFGVLYMLFVTYFEAYGSFSQTGTVLALGFFLSASLVFFFSLFVIPGVFYFSKDNNTLLCLPLKPHTILSAKFMNCLIYDYAFSIFVVIPLGVAYAQFLPFGIWEFLCFLIIALTLPIIPLIYSSIITMIVMRFVPFVKNKDVFNMISGFLIVFFAFGLSFYLNSLSPADEAALTAMLMEGNNSMIQLFSTFFPFVTNASNMIIDADVMQFILYALWHFGFIALFLFIGNCIYFKGAIGINESSSKSARIDVGKHTRKSPILKAYAVKELKLLIRTPAYFLNCIMSIIIVPFMILIMGFQPEIRDGLALLPIHELLNLPGIAYYIIMVLVIINCFIVPLNTISSTAISREGDHVSFMKFIPVSYSTQIFAKTINGIGIGLLGMLPLWVIIIAYLDFPIMLSLVSLIAIILSNVALNLIGILIDINHPKLIWEQETAAVKQNINGFLIVMVGMLLSFLIGVGLFFVSPDMMMYLTMGVLMLFVVIIAICYVIMQKYTMKMFEKIS